MTPTPTMHPPLRISSASLLLIMIVAQASSRPQGEEGAAMMREDREATNTHRALNYQTRTRDPLRWVWIDETSLELTWSSKFSLSLNDAVMGYGLSLTHPQQSKPFTTTIIYDANNLHHQFDGLKSNITYGGKLEALVGPHHWPYNLLNFTFSSAILMPGVGLGQRSSIIHRPDSSIADLGSVVVGVTLRWSHSPFTTGALTTSEWDAGGGRPHGVKPDGYLLRIWDHNHLVLKLTTSVTGKHDGCVAAISGLALDTLYKATLEGLHSDGRVGTTLSFSMDAGGFHVSGGGLTTDGVSECYSGLQVRCPGSERCVSPYWICDGAPDCPDGVDEIGCDKSPCDGFRCWDNVCIPGAWRCDGHHDCKDGDDEYACSGCSDGEMPCSTVGFCYFPNSTCDGIPDCPDGWDESLAVCGGKECSPGELPCWDNDHCVQHYRLCDGTPDCPTAEDEDRSFCITFKSMQETTTLAVDLQASLCDHNNFFKETNCSLDEFRCESGECIPRMYLCNGYFDCQTEDDEEPQSCPLDNDIFNAKNQNSKNITDIEELGINSCGENMLKCPSGKCVLKNEKCLTNALCDDNHMGEISCKNYSETILNNEIGSNSIDGDFDSTVHKNINNSLVFDISPTSSSEWEERQDSENEPDNRILNQFKISESENNNTGMVKNGNVSFTTPPIIQDINLESLEDASETSFITSSDENRFVQEDITFNGIDVSVEVIVEESAESSEDELDESETISDDDDNLIGDFESSDEKEMTRPLGNISFAANTSISISVNGSDESGHFIDELGKMDGGDDTDMSEYDISIFENLNASSSEENEVNSILINSTRILNLDSDEEMDLEKPKDISGNSFNNVDIKNTSIPLNLDETKIKFPEKENVNVTETSNQNVTNAVDEDMIMNNQNETENMTTESPVYDSTFSAVPIIVDDGLNTNTEALNISDISFSNTDSTEGSPPSLIDNDDKDAPLQNITTKEPTVDDELSPSPNITEVSSVDGDSMKKPEIFEGPTTHTKLSPQLNHSEEATKSDPDKQTPPKKEEEEEEEEEEEHKSSTKVSLSGSDVLATGNGSSTTALPTEPSNWKEMPMGQKNLTILIAVHSLGNESKIPQYIIHGMDGSTYEYEVVSINEEENALNKTERRGEESEMHLINNDLNGGIHELSYLQDTVSAGRRSSMCVMLIMAPIINIFLTIFKE